MYQTSHIVWQRHAASTLADELVSQLGSLPCLPYLTPLRWARCKFWGIFSQHVQKGDSSALVLSGLKEKAHEVDWLGDELLAFGPPQAGSSWPTARSGDANSSRQSQDGFFSSDLSATCSLSKQSPKYVHDFILTCCLRHLPTYLFLQSQVTHIPVDHI